TPAGDGTLSVQVPADVAEDAATNSNTASNTVEASYDGTAPTVALSALTGPVAGVYTTTATFSEAVTGLDAADLTLVNASATLTGSGAVYTITLTPAADGTLSVQVPADVAEDAATNGNTASNTVETSYDGTAPTVALSALTGPVGGVYTTTATFSEAVTGLDASDLTLVNASATLSGSGSVYEITLTPAGDGTLSVQIPADVAEDAASNGNTASNSVSATYDGTAPTVTLAALTGPSSGVYTTTATFSEAVTGLDAADLTLVNASATLTGSGAVYEITLTPAGDGTLSVQVPADVAEDAATNGNTASNTVEATYDGTAPTVSLSALTGPVGGVYTTTATFSEAVTGLDASDLTLVNASATLTGSGSIYEITVTPAGDGTLSVQIPADVAEDAAGNENTASDAVEAIHDGTPPTVSLSEFTGPADGTFSAEITLSEPSDDFALGDLHLVNATGVLSGAGTGYRLVATPVADGLVSAQVVAGSFTDAAGNANTEPSNLVSVIYDGTAPTVTIAEAPEAFSGAASLSVTILFSEAVSGFEPEGILARNARVIDLSGAGDRYMATIRADGAGDVTLQISAGAARDAAGNDNLASEAVHIENRTVAETQGQIARFMLHRADQLVSNQPGLICLMQGSCGGGALSVNTNEDGLRFSVSTMSSALTAGWPLWMQVQGARSDDPDGDTEYLIGTIGAHQEISDRLYLGVMLQFDHVARNDGIGRIEGSGWLAGPYVVGRLADHPLYFEGRLLWGQTRNTITPFGTYSDRFDTERMLAMARISGEMVFGDVTLMPTVAASHTTDRQQAYIDSLGNVIGAQDIALTRLELGFDARWPVTLGLSEWILEGGIRALHTRSSGSGLTLADSAPVDGTRGRINLGIRHVTRAGGEFSMSGYYDGIGQADYEGYGLEIGYHHDF
ncbi:Ig-like domain-containing protein, partial [Pararhodobacter marinus]|uniref:Ig-like domain-containing protein n=1 Tax=Pararhodobacter marinus TaxID=2184063 RepID=UPI003516CE91